MKRLVLSYLCLATGALHALHLHNVMPKMAEARQRSTAVGYDGEVSIDLEQHAHVDHPVHLHRATVVRKEISSNGESLGDSFNVLSTSPPLTADAKSSEQTAEGAGVRVPLQPAHSQVELSLVSGLVHRFRAFLRDSSVGVLVVVAILAFLLGIVFAMVLVSSFKNGGKNGFDLFGEGLIEGTSQDKSGSDPEPVEELMLKFDFETQDEADRKFRRWQWCTLDQMDKMGLLTQAPTKPFQGYKRIDVAPNRKDVEEVLLSSHVDGTVFDFERDGENLLWKLLRAEAYFMLIHGGQSSQRILVMMETVRLRWTYNGRFLVQNRDKTFLARAACLPGHEKPGSESPVTTAKQMWQTLFKLPPEIANFVEDSIEDNEMVGYRGLHCVERCHIIDVKLHPRLSDTSVLNKVGLPNHRDFTASDPNNLGEGDRELPKNFTWLTKEECKAAGVMLNDSGAVTMIDLTSLDGTTRTCDEKLRKFLEDAGVDVDSPHWQDSKRGTSKLADLSSELAKGKCFITNTSDGLHRCVTVVATRLWSPDRQLMLVEKGRKYASGEEEWSVRLPGSKKDSSESLMDVGMRVINTQLNLNQDNVAFTVDTAWEYFDYTEPSSRYVGLLTKYQKFFVDVVIEDDEDLWNRIGLSSKIRGGDSPRSGQAI